jgi:hypothetical protein
MSEAALARVDELVLFERPVAWESLGRSRRQDARGRGGSRQQSRSSGRRTPGRPPDRLQPVLLSPRPLLRLPGHPPQSGRHDPEPLPGGRAAAEAALVRLHADCRLARPTRGVSRDRCSRATSSSSSPSRRRLACWRRSSSSSALPAGRSSSRRSRAPTRIRTRARRRARRRRLCSTFHRHLGVAVGECLGYLFTGGWTLLVAVAMLQSSSFDDWLAWPGVAVGAFGSRGLTGLKEMLEGSVSHRRTRSPNMPGGR